MRKPTQLQGPWRAPFRTWCVLGREQREQAPQAAATGLVGAGQAGRGAKGGPSGFSESGCFPAVTLTDLKKTNPWQLTCGVKGMRTTKAAQTRGLGIPEVVCFPSSPQRAKMRLFSQIILPTVTNSPKSAQYTVFGVGGVSST